MTSVTPAKKIPLEWAASALTMLSQQIEDGSNLDDAILALFNEAKIDSALSIDRRQAFCRYLKMMIDLCKADKAATNDRQKFFEAALERVSEKTKKTIEENPDIPFVNSLGKKLMVVRNGTPKLQLKLVFVAAKSVSNIVDAAQCEFFGVDKKYLKQVSYLTLDTELLKADLRSGVECEWAELEFNTQLRGL